MTDQQLRQAPHNLEAEQALLGAILINNAAHDRVSDFLEPHHFYDPLHQQIFETAAKLITSGKQATPITLKTFFEHAEPIDATLTVPQYLGRLAAGAATIINARDYGHTVRDLAIRRNLILIGEDMVNAAYDAPVDFPPKEQIEEAEARLYALAERGNQGGGEVTAAAMQTSAFEAIERAYENRGAPTELSTGLRDLDAKMGRLQPSDLIILAGRPSMGKTSLATNIIGNQTEPVLFFSPEMSAQQIAMRLLAEEAGVASERLRSGDLRDDPEAWRRLLAAKKKLSEQPLIVDQTGGISIAQLMARARVKRRHGIQLIVVDFIQLLTGTSKRAENRTAVVTEITAGLKALAKELNLPVLALSQLSRGVEGREDKRPNLADLRDSGSIEQDADLVLFVYREAYYVERRRPSDDKPDDQRVWLGEMMQVLGRAEVIVAKYRNGPAPSTVKLHFDPALTKFSDLAVSGYAEVRQ